MSWFIRTAKNIIGTERKEMPVDSWIKNPSTGKTIHRSQLEENMWVDSNNGYHFRINAYEYFAILFDGKRYKTIGEDILPVDKLNFVDTKTYKERLEKSSKASELTEAVVVAKGNLFHHSVVIAAMDFRFIGGSMGSVVGERISLAVRHAIKYRFPLIIISQSGGARMMEGALSLMQMPKILAQLTFLNDANIPYISVMTNPTTGGVAASFAMLGDVNIAEPGALIGFTGPRVIRQAIGKNLPPDFQTAEYLLEHGFIDLIIPRTELKKKISLLLDFFKNSKTKV